MEDMAENKNDEEQEPIRVNTREEFDDALDELFETGRPIEAPSVEALEEWGVDLEDEGGGEPRVVCGRGETASPWRPGASCGGGRVPSG